MENKIQEIYDRLNTDQAFAEELKNFLENKKFESAEDGMTAFIEFAKLHGYDITPDDVQAFAETQYNALSEEELEKVLDYYVDIKKNVCGFLCYFRTGSALCTK